MMNSIIDFRNALRIPVNSLNFSKRYQNVEEVLILQRRIHSRVQDLASELDEFYRNHRLEDIQIRYITNGSIYFCSDLSSAMETRCSLDVICSSSYRGKSTVPTQEPEIYVPNAPSMTNENILIVEDIVDTGETLTKIIKAHVEPWKPKSIQIVSLLNKPERRSDTAELPTDMFYGFIIPDKFVVGYGLDYGREYRDLWDICVLKEELYSSN